MFKSPLLALFCLAGFSALPAGAQDFEKPITDCRAVFKSLGPLQRTDTTRVEPMSTGCHFNDIAIDFGPYNRFSVTDLTISGPDLLPALGEARLPSQLDVLLEGVRLAPMIGDNPLTSYIIEMQQEPYTARFAATLDHTNDRLDIAEISIEGRFIGRLAVSGRLSGLANMTDLLTGRDTVLNATIEAMTIDFDNKSFFTGFIAAALVGLLPSDEDPRPHIVAAQDTLTGTIAGLPDAQASAQTKQVLERFINDFPRPYGHYKLALEPLVGPLPLRDLGLEDMAAFAAILQRLKFSASMTELVDL